MMMTHDQDTESIGSSKNSLATAGIHEEPATAANRGHFSSLGDAFLIFKKNLIYLPILLVLLSDQMNFTKMALIKSNINQNF